MGKLTWFIWFIASFGGLHKGLEVFGIDIPGMLMPTMPMVAKGLMLVIGVCGLISLLTLFMGSSCTPCKSD